MSVFSFYMSVCLAGCLWDLISGVLFFLVICLEGLVWFETTGGSIVVSCDRWDRGGEIYDRLLTFSLSRPVLCMILPLA